MRLLESILQSFSTDASFAFDGCTESERMARVHV